MSKLVITTVGTSLFENFLQNRGKNDHTFSEFYQELKKNPSPFSEWEDKRHDVSEMKKRMERNSVYFQHPDLSAEIASILAIQKELNEEVNVHLLATDTVLSVLAAELIKAWFEQEGNREKYPGIKEVWFEKPNPGFQNQQDSQYVIKNLRIDKQSDFEKGMMNLLQVLNAISTKDILNITGGYKGIIPITTIWAQINKVPVKYLFNESELDAVVQPLTLERLPIHFDWEFIEAVAYALNENVRMNLKAENEQDMKVLELLANNKLVKDDRSLTAFGAIIQQYLNQDGQPTANNILGLFVEYKLFEFFSISKYKGVKYQPEKISVFENPNGTLTDQKNEDNKGSGYCEIDLFLKKPDGAFIIGEVKAYNQTGDKTIKELVGKERKYEEFKPSNKADELWLIVVSASLKTSLGEWHQNPKDPKLAALQRGKKRLGARFRAFSYQFDLSSGKLLKGIAAVNTASLLRNAIHENELIEIEFSNV